MSISIDLKVQPQFLFLYEEDYDECIIHSGRGAGKSWAVADYIIIQSLKEKIKILCTRQIQKSLNDSVKQLITNRIKKFGLSDYFTITQRNIVCNFTGSEFIFAGLQDHTVESIKSFEGINICWIEEAQTVTEYSLEILFPTIRRVENYKIFMTYNPRYAADAVYKRYQNNKQIPDKTIVKEVYTKDNIYLTSSMKRQMEFDFKHNTEVANWTWLGALCPSSSEMSVIPLEWLKRCVDAHVNIDIDYPSYTYAGFDVADTGKDSCAVALIHGPVVREATEFNSKFINESVNYVHNWTHNKKIARLYYDAVGVGSGAKSDFNLLTRDYIVESFKGSYAVSGGDNIFTGNVTNRQYFGNFKSQAWWNIRLRVENTLRFLDGQNINPNKCFFLSKNILNLEKLMLELSQAVYKQELSKLYVDKAPDNMNSPNLADSVVMAFTRDLKNGLRVN